MVNQRPQATSSIAPNMRIFLLFLLLHVGLLSLAQQGVIEGTVTDAETGETLIGVNVVAGENQGVATDIEGKYTLRLEPGNYGLTFKYIGYDPVSVTIDVVENKTVIRNIKLQSTMNELDMVVVSAGRYEQRVEELTMSMEVIKPYLIENRNNTSIAQVMDQTPGVILVDGEPQIRGGSGYSFGAGSRVQVLLDDIPVLSGDIGRPNWEYLPTENVEQVEVIKGASSVLYGSSALSGVINLRTAYPRDEPKTKVSIFTGVYSAPPSARNNIYWKDPNYQHEKPFYHPIQDVVRAPLQTGANFFHSRKIKQLDFVFGANFFSDMGFTGPEFAESFDENGDPLVWDQITESGDTLWRPPSQMSENRLRGNLNLRYRFKKTKGLSVGINSNGMYSHSSFALLWLNADTALYRPQTRGITVTKQLNFNIDPYIEYVGQRGGKHKLKTRYYHLDNINTNNQSNFSRTYFAEYTASQDFEHYGIEGLNISAGAMTSYTTARSNLYIANEDGDGNNDAHNTALFMQVDKRFFDRLTISGGVRYEWYRVNSDLNEAPIFRAGANMQLLDGTFVRASIGQGIRFPTIGERFIVTAVGGQNIFPNPGLQAERSYNAEFGVKQGFEVGSFQGFFDAAIFYQEFDNYIEFTFGPWGSYTVQVGDQVFLDAGNLDKILGFQSVNTGRASVKGLDLSLVGEGKLGEIRLRMLMGYTYVLPQSLDPDFEYATPELREVLSEDNYPDGELFAPVTYNNTSSFNDNNLLKYRVEHMGKLDIEASHGRFSLGTSVRAHTPIRNIDYTFILLDEDVGQGGLGLLPSGVTNWMEDQPDVIGIVDLRASVKIGVRSKVSFIVNNLLNTEFAIRPLTIESPRVTMLQYAYEI